MNGLLLLLALAAAPPQRIASMNLSADEVLVEIAPERLVSVTRFVDEQGTGNVVGRVPKSVARIHRADMEQLVALRPDLVIVSEYTDADFLKQLERSGMRFHRMQGLASMAGIRAAILDLGRAVDALPAAEKLVARYDATLADVARHLEGVTRPRVLYWSGSMTAGADTALGALIECGGGANVGREMGLSGIVPPGAERAFASDPDAFLVGTWPRSIEALKEDPLMSQMRAVRTNRILVLPSPLLVALSQFSADACRELALRLHPDRFPRARP